MTVARHEKKSALSFMPRPDSFTSFKVRISERLMVRPAPREPMLKERAWSWVEVPTSSYQPRILCASGMSGLIAIVLELNMERERPRILEMESGVT